MSGALAAAASGLAFQGMKVKQISHDLANMDTTAHKFAEVYGVDSAYQSLQGAGTPTSAEGTINPTGLQIGMGVTPIGVSRVMKQGEAKITDNPLDLMIDGEGFFPIELPNGETGYTRDGSFKTNKEGQIITMAGFKVKPDLVIPAHTTRIDINHEGQVYAKIDGQIDPVLVGQLEIAVFANAAGLAAKGGNLYLETPASGAPTSGPAGSIGFGAVLQSTLEGSNVTPVVQLTSLIEAQRAYAMNTKTMNAVEEMDRNLQSLMR